MASRALQAAFRTASSLAKTAVRPTATLNKKFSTHSAPSAPQPTTPASDAVNTKSTFTTVADHGRLNSKFRVPFDENPLQMQEDFIEQVEAIPLDVQKERGYHIIGKVKATSSDSLQKLLALGDMRIYQ